jgi:uncharacterized spore protein YtfJ
MALDDLVKQVAASLEREGSPHAVFGDAVKLEHHTIVPVAVVSSGAGGGGAAPGSSSARSASSHSKGSGSVSPMAGGAGFALMVRPVGFIHEEDGEVVFTPIHVDRSTSALMNEAAEAVRRLVSLATGFVSRVFKRAEIAPPSPSVEGIASPS